MVETLHVHRCVFPATAMPGNQDGEVARFNRFTEDQIDSSIARGDAFELAKRMKEGPVRTGVCDGLVGNRILAAHKLAGDYLVGDGASPYQLDKAMRDFGFAIGMFQITDLAGCDIGWSNPKRRAVTRDPNQRYVEISDRICEHG
jgi:3-hydroxyacyl-CoA dehydrogenase